MSSQQDDLLASVSTRLSSPATTPTPPTSTAPKELCDLQSSLRNALATFGPTSAQYASIKYVVDEHMAKAALQSLSLGPREGNGQTMDLAFIPRGE
ncbi:hypothetical protein PMIN01_00419 [Paraphaeosphaeria minitans]|uniref:Uncharacterized protein n=1 Tax=Paraphaeosphaeria minitans TaxID=565426 RepID=A0A9P6GTK1_9PLEO|nr:hypothetical protein PMIN01_00419 [Paraphaeosphaeria minitans]